MTMEVITSYAELWKINKAEFLEILEEFDDIKKEITKIAYERSKELNILSKLS